MATLGWRILLILLLLLRLPLWLVRLVLLLLLWILIPARLERHRRCSALRVLLLRLLLEAGVVCRSGADPALERLRRRAAGRAAHVAGLLLLLLVGGDGVGAVVRRLGHAGARVEGRGRRAAAGGVHHLLRGGAVGAALGRLRGHRGGHLRRGAVRRGLTDVVVPVLPLLVDDDEGDEAGDEGEAACGMGLVR